MHPPIETIHRALGPSLYISLYFGEPSPTPECIKLIRDLNNREYRRLEKHIRPGKYPGAKPVLVLNCDLQFPRDLEPTALERFLARCPHPSFGQEVCYSDRVANADIFERLTARLGQHAGWVSHLRGIGSCVYYPVSQGDRLMVAHFAI
jgi:hypothetical protein